VRLYITQISDAFQISSVATQPKATPSASFVPAGSNSLTTSHYLFKIISEINDCVNDVTSVELSAEASNALQELLQGARWRFEEVLCDAWQKGPPFNLYDGWYPLIAGPPRCPDISLSGNLDPEPRDP